MVLILERLLAGLKDACADFPDKRKSAGVYSMADIGLSAFSLFFMQSESFLSYQRSLEEGRKTSNCQTLFGMAKIPTDNHIRSMLDPVHPSHLQSAFDQAMAELHGNGGLKTFQRLDGRVLIALDGTEFFCSQKLGCANCQTRKRANGKVESYHSMLAATVVAPGHNMALPLMPEFIVKPDGAAKQDCERNAAKRWLAAHGELIKELRPVYLGDDLFACQPIAEAALSSGGDFLFTAKPESHKALYDFMNGATLDEVSITRKEGSKKLTHRYRWFCGAPLREGNDALMVDWIGLTISDAKGKVTYDGAFLTSLRVTRENVAEIAACARARWKIENESFNVLKNNGYHLEHNFGHGKENLAMMFAAMNLLAFAFHTVCDCLEDLWIKAREAKRARRRLFEHIRTITAYLVFPSWKSS
jgi:Glycosyl transferase family, helical bundle domain